VGQNQNAREVENEIVCVAIGALMLGAAASAQTALDIEGNFTPPMDQFSAFANACAAWVDHGDAAFFDRLPAAAIDEYQAFATDHR